MRKTLCAAFVLLALAAAAPAQATKPPARTKKGDARAGQKPRRAAAPRTFVETSKGQLVETLEIEGNRRLSDEEILAHIVTRPGRPYSQAQVLGDFHTLLDLGLFVPGKTSVKTERGLRGGVVVTFHVAELPVVEGLAFRGLPPEVSESEARAAVSEATLTTRTTCAARSRPSGRC
jgi:outer membrane protein assembly factor BamA